MTERPEVVVGVDAGGTGTTAWVCSADDQKLRGTGTAGSGNPRSVGFEVAQQNIATAIFAAITDAQAEATDVAATCLCVAGAGRPEEQQRLLDWAYDQAWGQRKVRIATDAEAVIAAGSPDLIGVALICGTGSLVWGRNEAGNIQRAGGWGYLFGDEGSAYWIAAQALSIASQMADGRWKSTELLPILLQAASVTNATELIEFIYGSDNPRQQIASLAPAVFDAALAGESHSADILSLAAEELAEMIDAGCRKLELQRPVLCLTGSVIVHQTEFRQQVIESVKAELQDVYVVEHPAAGAIALAARLLE